MINVINNASKVCSFMSSRSIRPSNRMTIAVSEENSVAGIFSGILIVSHLGSM